MWWKFIYSLEETFPEFSQAIGQGAFIGVMLGAMAGFVLFLALLSLIWGMLCLTGRRTERLMLRFHDELLKKEEDRQPDAQADG